MYYVYTSVYTDTCSTTIAMSILLLLLVAPRLYESYTSDTLACLAVSLWHVLYDFQHNHVTTAQTHIYGIYGAGTTYTTITAVAIIISTLLY
jgi:E3 ubiquitin-protein ligase DOA10